MEETKAEDIMAELLAPTSAMEKVDYSLKEDCGIVDCDPDEEDEDEYEEEEYEEELYDIEEDYIRRMRNAIEDIESAIYRAENHYYTEEDHRYFIARIDELGDAASNVEAASTDYYNE